MVHVVSIYFGSIILLPPRLNTGSLDSLDCLDCFYIYSLGVFSRLRSGLLDKPFACSALNALEASVEPFKVAMPQGCRLCMVGPSGFQFGLCDMSGARKGNVCRPLLFVAVLRFVAVYFAKFRYSFLPSLMEQVANLWLIIIGGSIFNQLDPFIDRPASIVDLLGASVPGKAQVGGRAGGPLDTC